FVTRSCYVFGSRLRAGFSSTLRDLTGAPHARPGPLKIVAAQPPGNVDRLADKVKSRHRTCLHRSGGKRRSIYTARRYLRPGPPFGTRWRYAPAVHAFGDRSQQAIGQIRDWLIRCGPRDDFSKATGQHLAQDRFQFSPGTSALAVLQQPRAVDPGNRSIE